METQTGAPFAHNYLGAVEGKRSEVIIKDVTSLISILDDFLL